MLYAASLYSLAQFSNAFQHHHWQTKIECRLWFCELTIVYVFFWFFGKIFIHEPFQIMVFQLMSQPKFVNDKFFGSLQSWNSTRIRVWQEFDSNQRQCALTLSWCLQQKVFCGSQKVRTVMRRQTNPVLRTCHATSLLQKYVYVLSIKEMFLHSRTLCMSSLATYILKANYLILAGIMVWHQHLSGHKERWTPPEYEWEASYGYY